MAGCEMYYRHVVKRSGQKENVDVEKIYRRIERMACNLSTRYVDWKRVAKRTSEGLFNGITTIEIDTLASENAADLIVNHPDYSKLAARIVTSQLYKSTPSKFSEAIDALVSLDNDKPMISYYHYRVVCQYKAELNDAIMEENDQLYDYFGIRTLLRSYLLRDCSGNIVERPQYMLMRVALGIHGKDIGNLLETYRLMSHQMFIHATPTLFAAATLKPQLSSCFLMTIKGDSIASIYDTVKDCALISQASGGIGLNIHDIRAKNSSISSTNGRSNGLVSMLRVFNNTSQHVDQGGGKRSGSFCIYLEPWHADIIDFLELKRNQGSDSCRARELFYGLWVPDLFMKRADEGKLWSLMCPSECPGLADVWGDDFERLYTQYEDEGRFRRQIYASELWLRIVNSQLESGTPFIMYKDACNRKSNHANLGTIRCGNLCTEIVQYSSPSEMAVCNIGSVSLPSFIKSNCDGTKYFDVFKLKQVAMILTRNLNKIIDINHYPTQESKFSNLQHRPIGIGVQGMADMFAVLGYPYDSELANKLNILIFETLYFAALSASCELAVESQPYKSYKGSPISHGILQFDMWNVKPTSTWDWNKLRHDISMYGVRNSLLIALMPTATTAHIMGNSESFEPFSSNIYSRKVLCGDYSVINRHLVEKLSEIDMWNEVIRNKIIESRGSVQLIEEIPLEIRKIFKTASEISQRTIIDMAAARGPFIDQSQSLNINVNDWSVQKVLSMHFYGWRRGLKTGLYYLRNKPGGFAAAQTCNSMRITSTEEEDEPPPPPICESCQ